MSESSNPLYKIVPPFGALGATFAYESGGKLLMNYFCGKSDGNLLPIFSVLWVIITLQLLVFVYTGLPQFLKGISELTNSAAIVSNQATHIPIGTQQQPYPPYVPPESVQQPPLPNYQQSAPPSFQQVPSPGYQERPPL